jgi:hypothetical protein
MLARTLLSSSGAEAYVRMLNCNPSVTTLLAGDLLSVAEPVKACNDDEIEVQNNLADHSVEHVQVFIDALPSVLSDEQKQEASRFGKCVSFI